MITKIIKINVWKRILLCLFTIATFVALGRIIPVKAAEAKDVEGILQQVSKDTELRQAPDENADILEKLESGTALIVYGEPEGSWSRAEYMGMEGYVKSDTLKGYSKGYEDELSKEFSVVDEETLRAADEYEFEEKEKRSSRVRMMVIGTLILAILALGVVSALKKEKETL